MFSALKMNGRGENVSPVTKRWASAIVAAALAVGTVSSVKADDFFDWGAVNTPVNSAYVQTPPLSDANVADIAAFLAAQQAAGKTTAVQVRAGVILSASTINTIFNNAAVPVKYVFADYEGSQPITGAIPGTTNLVTQLAGTNFGARKLAGTSFIGNYALAPIPLDPTQHATSTFFAGNSPTNPYATATDFRNTGVNMSAETLYPGDGSFRNPVNGDSTAPNIRSALFTLPIQRLSIASQNLGAGQAHIPFISRFNNFANPSLQNVGSTFNTTGPSIGTNAVAGQLLSRDDFQALVLHYKMRGASSYQLLDPGVVGYSVAQYESDAQAGWNDSQSGGLVKSVLSGLNGRVASLPTTITFKGVKQTIENAGVVWSAVTNDSVNSPGLAILVSNLSNTPGAVSFNTRINGATLAYTSNSLAAGAHTILRFTKSGGTWGSPLADTAFNDPALASRDGVGIPEPTALTLLGIGALGVLGRRRRKA